MDDYRVTEEAKFEYREQGVTVLRNVISQVWLDRLDAAIERDIVSPGPFYYGYNASDGQGRFHGNLRIWENDPDFANYCQHSVLSGIAQQLFASESVNLL